MGKYLLFKFLKTAPYENFFCAEKVKWKPSSKSEASLTFFTFSLGVAFIFVDPDSNLA